jgi:hypothetical protein
MICRQRTLPGSFYGATKITSTSTASSARLSILSMLENRISRTVGGCPFALDPALPARSAQVSWTPAFDPCKILLIPASIISPTADALPDGILPGSTSGDANARIILTDHPFDVALGEPAPGSPLAAVLLFDDDTPDRLAALSRFWSALRGLKTPPDDRVTPRRRARLRTMLRAVDGHRAGATYRNIGEALFPKHKIDAQSWVGNSVRETTIRLVRDGMKLVRGGYRDLLRRPHRS